MTNFLHLDYETACNVDLMKVGLDVYSAHPSCRVLMAAYRIGNGPLQHWEAHKQRIPVELKEALLDPRLERWAFNAQFERVITRRVLKILTPRKNWRCSMCLSYMQSFMGKLEDVGEQIGLPLDKQKLKDSKRLIRKFCMPQRITKNQPNEWRNWITDPDEWEVFCEYNKQDLIAEEAVKTRLIPFPVPEEEWEFYELDQLINDRGIPVDMDFIDNVIWMAARRKAELVAQMEKITGLGNPNSVSQLLPWLQAEGYPYSDITKESVEKTLKRAKAWQIDITDECYDVLKLRQWAARTSTSKAITAKNVVGNDGRARFLFQFAGAGRTNRFSGRTIQSQNMMRTPKELDAEEDEGRRLTFVTNLIRTGDYDGFDLFLNEPMLGLTGCMRSLFRAPDGENLTTCDLGQIEFIVLGYIARCQRIIDVYTSGRDPYKDFGVDFYKKPYEEVTRGERQICKPPVLACGYRLGKGTDKDGVKTGLLAYAENMGVEMTPEESERAVSVYREKFPEVKQYWYDCEKAIKYVMVTKKPFKLGCVTFKWMKPYLLIELPSGRCIFYYKPRLVPQTIRTGRMVTKRIRSRGMFEDGAPEGQWVDVEEEETYRKVAFTYMGRDQKTTRWSRVFAHGGVTCENIDQALSRDILMVGLKRCHEAGFYIVGHGHDEIMSLTKDGDNYHTHGDNYHTLDLKRELMTAPMPWATDLPLKASGWVGSFYRK